EAGGICLEGVERQAVRVRTEAVAVRPGSDHEVEHALRTAAHGQRLYELVGVASFDVRAASRDGLLHQTADDEVVQRVDVGVRTLTAEHTGEAEHGPPFRDLSGLEGYERWRVVRDVVDGEDVESEVAVAARELGFGLEE